jgi:hypothetical protein
MRECRSAKVRKIIALRARAAKLDADYEGGAGSPGAHEAPGAAAARRGPDAQGSAHRLRAGGAPAGVERGVAPTQMGYPAELDVRVSLRPGAGVSPAVRERGRPMAGPPPPRRGPEILPVTLTKDGRLVDRVQLERVAKAAGSVTDCFLFCHGWLYDEAEARQESACFFALLDGVLAPLRARIVPLRLGLHWPSKPFAAVPLTRDRLATGLWPELERGCAARSRRGASHSDLALLLDLCAAEIPRSSEEDAELDALVWQLTRSGRERGAALPVSPLHALSFWVMKRRAGEVGERFAREWMVSALALAGSPAPAPPDRPFVRRDARDVDGARRRAARKHHAAVRRLLRLRVRPVDPGVPPPRLLLPGPCRAAGRRADRGAALRPRRGARRVLPDRHGKRGRRPGQHARSGEAGWAPRSSGHYRGKRTGRRGCARCRGS